MDFLSLCKENLSKGERIIDYIIVSRSFLIKSASTEICLTNQRIIYSNYNALGLLVGNKFKLVSIQLLDISAVSYLPPFLQSAGGIRISTKDGKSKIITSSLVGQIEANEFIQKLKKELLKH